MILFTLGEILVSSLSSSSTVSKYILELFLRVNSISKFCQFIPKRHYEPYQPAGSFPFPGKCLTLLQLTSSKSNEMFGEWNVVECWLNYWVLALTSTNFLCSNIITLSYITTVLWHCTDRNSMQKVSFLRFTIKTDTSNAEIYV